jgi:YbbR domain-containing protein
VSLSGRRSLVREAVTIAVFDPSLRLKTPVTATVTVPVEPKPVERRVAGVPVRVRNAGPGLSAQVVPEAVAILTRGPKDVVDGLRADSASAFVDLAGMGPGRYNLPVRVEPAQDFVVVRTEPATVQVRIK